LAGAWQKLSTLSENRVIVAGRRRQALDETTAANPGMISLTLDVEDPGSIRSFAAELATHYPALNVLINNAGIMRAERLQSSTKISPTRNPWSPPTCWAHPSHRGAPALLQRQPHSAIMNVSSGLAFVPMARTPTYCATKAALHSYTQSLRYQLQGSTTEVLELIPPYVATHLMNGASDPRAMPLEAFLAEVMEILKTQPEAVEICVENVKRLRVAAESGRYDSVFRGLNEAMGRASI